MSEHTETWPEYRPLPWHTARLDCGHERHSAVGLPSENIYRDALFCNSCGRHRDVVERTVDVSR